MNMTRLILSGCLGAFLASTHMTPIFAETLRVLQGPATGALNVPINRAVVVESDVPFGEVSIANPGIADIATFTERSIYVLGKAPGRTTLTLLTPDGTLIANVEVQVTPDVAEFKERLQQILPGEPIEVRTANDGIVLSGQVSSTAKMDRALDLANRYAPDRVSNLMVVGGTQQVMLKVRFAEMQRSVGKALSSTLTVTSDNNTNRLDSGTGLATAFGGLGFEFGVGDLSFDVLLEALETKGM
ncbi:MAG: general secretion pathway protein, partial [Rhodobacterales bacterium 17-64-5]